MVRNSLKSEMSTLSIELWGQEEQPYEAEFQGTWLVDPELNETRAGPEDGTQWDLDAFYGVALTARGNILVYVAHCNDGWAPFYETYPSIEAARGDVPDSILAAAASSLGEDFYGHPRRLSPATALRRWPWTQRAAAPARAK